jgi:hypothetical protein
MKTTVFSKIGFSGVLIEREISKNKKKAFGDD